MVTIHEHPKHGGHQSERTGSEAGRYESELSSFLILGLVSAAARFWHVLMVIATLGVLTGLGMLLCEFFVRGMAWDLAKIARPWQFGSERTSQAAYPYPPEREASSLNLGEVPVR